MSDDRGEYSMSSSNRQMLSFKLIHRVRMLQSLDVTWE